jgi:DNA-binding NtrC family response regulator
MMEDKILVIEEDALMESAVVGLHAEGFEITRIDNLSKSYLAIMKSPPSIILTEYQLRDGTAFDLLAWLKARDIGIPLIVLTAYTRVELAVEAIKNGAEQFIPKPVDLGLLISVLRRTLENTRNQKKSLAHYLERARYERNPFLGNSPAILELRKAAIRVSEANSNVLIQGETGTGKGVLARWLHKTGPRSNEPFVDLNCAGLSHELLESEIFGHLKGAFTGAVMNKIGFLDAANHGTLFLDEIGDMDQHAQSKILKVVEEKLFYRLGDVRERKVDVQIIAATHRDLKMMAEEGKFRSDLYFRISALRLRIPSLRERLEDISIISNKLLEQFSWDMKRGSLRISEGARLELQRYSWPGNIRELRNVLERAALLSDDGEIHKTGLEFELPTARNLDANTNVENLTLKEMEKRYIIQVLESVGGRVSQAAKRLDIPRSSLYAKIQEHGLSKFTHSSNRLGPH